MPQDQSVKVSPYSKNTKCISDKKSGHQNSGDEERDIWESPRLAEDSPKESTPKLRRGGTTGREKGVLRYSEDSAEDMLT